MVDFLFTLLLSVGNVGAYALLAIGIVAIYRSSRVLNLAHGGMAMIPAYVTYSAVAWGLPVVLAVIVGVASGALLGWLVERVFVRPLRREGATAQTVGTVAALGLMLPITVLIWGGSILSAVQVFPQGDIGPAGSSVRYGQLGLFAVMAVLSAALFAVFKYTDTGLIMRGTAENPRAAALMGVNPQRVTNLAWMLGGALAGVAGILLASVTILSPYTLALQALPAFVAALIGGLERFPGAVIGGTIVGLAYVVVPEVGFEATGAEQLVLAVVAIVAMAVRGGSSLAGATLRGSR